MTTSRRKFLLRTTAGVAVLLGTSYCVPPILRRKIAASINRPNTSYDGNTSDPTLWFEITQSNRVIFHCPKVEMGQGIFTGLAQIAAEELEVNIERITVVHAATDSGNVDEFITGASTTTSGLWDPLRALAATMRVMLVREGARQLGADAGAITVTDGQVSGPAGSLTYGEIVASAGAWEIPETPPLKKRENYKYIGRPIPRVDLEDKVTGAPIYGMDAVLPGMLFGSIVRPHGLEDELISADTTDAERMPGVMKIVREKDFIGVVAESYLQAERAKLAVKAEWSAKKQWTYKAIEAKIRVGEGKPVEIQKEGNAEKLLKKGEEGVITSEYFTPIGAHAQLEPSGALADVREEGATVILSTQVVSITQEEVADRLGLKKEQVNIVPTFLGGGFGRRLHTPNAMQAAVLSRAVGRPVKCFFNRKEEFQNDTFRPPTHNVLRAILTPEGRIAAIEHHISSGDVMYGSPIVSRFSKFFIGADLGAWRGGMIQYRNIPNYRAVSWRVRLPFATSWWRGLGLLANTFAIESFVDELAERAGKHPVDFRLEHLADDKPGRRLRNVIETAAARGNYRNEAVNGRAWGFAASTDTNTPCAHVVEVSLEAGAIKVHRITCVLDPGLVVNPDQVRAQCEGGILMGMSAVLYEKMTVRDNELRPVIYGPYRMLQMRDTPREIEVILLEGDSKPGAVGEPPLGPIGAAIANAVYRLAGTRVRGLPLEAPVATKR